MLNYETMYVPLYLDFNNLESFLSMDTVNIVIFYLLAEERHSGNI